MTHAIEIKNLSYSYRSHWLLKSIRALTNLNLEVQAGEAFGFLGPNGAGKTTTIKCILGLVRPRAGEVLLFGKNSRDPQSRSQVGYLPEQPYFYDHLTVWEITEMYAVLSGVEPANLKSFIEDALRKVGMFERRKSPMRALSKGLTQRVALAQAIVAKPKLLILDEPFSGLDPIGRKEFRDIILEQRSLGTTILMSSHILSDVEFLCSRASILVKGELKGVFDLEALKTQAVKTYELMVKAQSGSEGKFTDLADSIHTQNSNLRMRFTQFSSATKALSICLSESIQIEHFGPEQANLEELFMEIVSQDA